MSSHPPFSDQAIEEKRLRLRKEADLKSAAAIEAATASAAAQARLAAFERQVADLLRAQKNLESEFGVGPNASPTVGGLKDNRSIAVEINVPEDTTGMTFNSLIDRYEVDERSPYKNLRFSTRTHYDVLIKRIRKDCGDWKVSEAADRRRIDRLYDDWTEGRTTKLSMAHGLITMVRMLANFGFKHLDDAGCKDLAITLHTMQFPVVETRSVELTAENADAIIKKAHELGRHSLALAQAIQFECRQLSQKDVIGEWVPLTEQGPLTSIVHYDAKWVRGLRWEELDQSTLTLEHISSADDDQLIKVDFNECPRVIKEFGSLRKGLPWNVLPQSGPIIISEASGRPWVPGEFRRWWRKVARECGIPDEVRNSDSRPATKPRSKQGAMKEKRSAAD